MAGKLGKFPTLEGVDKRKPPRLYLAVSSSESYKPNGTTASLP